MTPIIIDRATVEQALEALEAVLPQNMGPLIHPAKQALKAALAQQAESPCACWPGRMCSRQAQCAATVRAQQAEPVAWAFRHRDGTYHDPSVTEHSAGMVPLYPPPPPQAEPVHPSGFAYRYPDGVRFNNGGEVNGCLPSEVIPYYLGKAPHQQQAEPVEPVAWIQPDHLQKARVAPFLCRVEPTKRCADFVPFWTAPPQRPPLTDEEFDALCKANSFGAVARNQFPLIPRAMLKALVDAAVERKVRGEEK